jgi:anti-sigma factor RsiW
MTQIINLRSGDHDEAQALLPWYVTGAIDAADRARVESHLPACPQCQAELAAERRLAEEVAGLSIDVAHGWAALRPRLENRPRRARHEALGDRIRRAWGASPAWLGWAVAAQVGALVVLALVLHPGSQADRYRALGASTAPPAANLVVIFRPDTSEADLRGAVRAVDGRLVGGPTAADAYLLSVPVATRRQALARLQARAEIELAEPIDAGVSP